MTKLNKTQKEELKHNVVFSCSKHGKETYFNIKKLEKKRTMRSFVYVWFFDAHGRQEKMWVRIRSGSQRAGFGTLDNAPVLLTHLKLNDPVHFRTDRYGITKPITKENSHA